VVATGGMAELIAAETDVIEAVEPNLMLVGLRMIHEMNSGDRAIR
jgi:type III pantothenate kinase